MKTEEQRLYDELYDRDSRRVSTVEEIRELINEPIPQDYPDARKHQIVSFIKSGIRILGYILIPFNLFWAAGILVLSEVVGIIEELV